MQKKCKCGEHLITISDEIILGRNDAYWVVCPLVLCGCDECEHTSYRGKINDNGQNTMYNLSEIY